MAVVPLDDIWVTANFEETQRDRMQPEGDRSNLKKQSFEALYILRKIESGEQVKFRPNMSV